MFNIFGTLLETHCGGTDRQTDMRAYRAAIAAKNTRTEAFTDTQTNMRAYRAAIAAKIKVQTVFSVWFESVKFYLFTKASQPCFGQNTEFIFFFNIPAHIVRLWMSWSTNIV